MLLVSMIESGSQHIPINQCHSPRFDFVDVCNIDLQKFSRYAPPRGCWLPWWEYAFRLRQMKQITRRCAAYFNQDLTFWGMFSNRGCHCEMHCTPRNKIWRVNGGPSTIYLFVSYYKQILQKGSYCWTNNQSLFAKYICVCSLLIPWNNAWLPITDKYSLPIGCI